MFSSTCPEKQAVTSPTAYVATAFIAAMMAWGPQPQALAQTVPIQQQPPQVQTRDQMPQIPEQVLVPQVPEQQSVSQIPEQGHVLEAPTQQSVWSLDVLEQQSTQPHTDQPSQVRTEVQMWNASAQPPAYKPPVGWDFDKRKDSGRSIADAAREAKKNKVTRAKYVITNDDIVSKK